MTSTERVRNPRGLTWPDRSRWYAYLTFMLVFYALFFPVYFGTQFLVSPARPGLLLFFDWETRIPLVPWMIWPYLSVLTLFAVPLLQMTSNEMRRLTLQSTIPPVDGRRLLPRVSLPDRLPAGRDRRTAPADIRPLRAIDTPQNLVPSLHIAFSALILLGSRQVTIAPLRPFYLAWMMLMACAVVLVHQHHIIDVVTGLVAAAIARVVFPLESQSGTSTMRERRAAGTHSSRP